VSVSLVCPFCDRNATVVNEHGYRCPDHADVPDGALPIPPVCPHGRRVGQCETCALDALRARLATADAALGHARALVAALPRCGRLDCPRPATRVIHGQVCLCDEHGASVGDGPYAAPLRALRALLDD